MADTSRVYVRAWTLCCFHRLTGIQTFRKVLTASVDSCAEIKSAPLWRNHYWHSLEEGAGKRCSERAWRLYVYIMSTHNPRTCTYTSTTMWWHITWVPMSCACTYNHHNMVVHYIGAEFLRLYLQWPGGGTLHGCTRHVPVPTMTRRWCYMWVQSPGACTYNDHKAVVHYMGAEFLRLYLQWPGRGTLHRCTRHAPVPTMTRRWWYIT